MSVKDLITNPAGRRSTSDTITFFTFLITSAVVIWYGWKLELQEWMFTAYIVAWAGHNISSKVVAMKRDQTIPTQPTPGGASDVQPQ